MARTLFAALAAAVLIAACAPSTPTGPSDAAGPAPPRFDGDPPPPPPDTTCRNGMLGSGTRC